MRHFLFLLAFIFTLTLTSCATRVAVRTPHTSIVKVAPKHYKIVIVKGKRYYIWNGKHYKKTRRGFVLVRV